jgi:hypothetical protein
VELDFALIYPVYCGVRCNQENGLCRERLAVNNFYCDPNAPQLPLTEIPKSDYPLDLVSVSPLLMDVEAATYPACSVVVDPSTYTESIIQSMALNDFIVLEAISNQYTVLQLKRDSPVSWQNTGYSKNGFVFTNETILYGKFKCSREPCQVSIWLSNLTTAHTVNPASKVVLANFTTSPFLITLNASTLSSSTVYKHLGWDFTGLVKGDTVRIDSVLASNPQTRFHCQRDFPYKIFEMPSSMEFASARNKCMFTYHPFLDNIGPGQCWCQDPSTGGETCEALAVISRFKGVKLVCGGVGEPGYWAVDYNGELVPVDKDGSWRSARDPSVWGCKVINPGLILRTRFFPETRFDYPYVFLTVRKLGVEDFEIVQPVTDDETGDPVVLTYSNTRQTCNSESMALSTWLTGDEAANFFDKAADVRTFVDLERNSEGDFQWRNREATLVQCSDDDCGMTLQNPCETDPVGGACFAVQFNNLAYRQLAASASLANLTDGTTNTAVTLTTTAVFVLRARTYEGVTVQIYPPTATVAVALYEPDTASCTEIGTGLGQWTCAMPTDDGYIDSIRVSAVLAVVKEVTIHALSDGTRFTEFYSSL